MIKRKILIVLLSLGTVGGYAVGFASMRHCARHRRDRFEHHVAKVCVEAANDAKQGHAKKDLERDDEE